MNMTEALNILKIDVDAEIKKAGIEVKIENEQLLTDLLQVKIKQAYKQLIKENHPDIAEGKEEYAIKLNAAIERARHLKIKCPPPKQVIIINPLMFMYSGTGVVYTDFMNIVSNGSSSTDSVF